jgi:glycosyltransferase involved in cell wall biosynthesis
MAAEGVVAVQDMPAVCVVIPCRNAAPWIAETLDSLHGQSLLPAEVVVVDDGSTDGSAEVVRAWMAAHAALPVTLVRQRWAGLKVAMDTAVSASNSPLLCRVDADDVVGVDYLGLLVAALDGHPSVGYAYPLMTMFGDREGPYYTRDFSAASLVFQGNFVCAGALMRRSAYLASGGLAELPAWEDWDLWLRFLGAGWEGVLVPAADYRWRRHGATRNTLTWRQRRWLRLRIWWRHRGLVRRYAPQAVPLLIDRLRHRVSQQ